MFLKRTKNVIYYLISNIIGLLVVTGVILYLKEIMVTQFYIRRRTTVRDVVPP